MSLNTPLFIFLRVIVYGIIVYGISEAIFFDASHPMEDGYFGEISLTEFAQELIFLLLSVFYIFLAYKQREIQSIAIIVALFYFMSFIREFNFLVEFWFYPVMGLAVILVWVVIRHYKNIKQASLAFFRVPASGWLLAGFMTTYIFSRLMGRSKFWKLLYSDETYRLAKAATEEGIELMGNTLMLIAAIEFALYYIIQHRNSVHK